MLLLSLVVTGVLGMNTPAQAEDSVEVIMKTKHSADRHISDEDAKIVSRRSFGGPQLPLELQGSKQKILLVRGRGLVDFAQLEDFYKTQTVSYLGAETWFAKGSFQHYVRTTYSKKVSAHCAFLATRQPAQKKHLIFEPQTRFSIQPSTYVETTKEKSFISFEFSGKYLARGKSWQTTPTAKLVCTGNATLAEIRSGTTSALKLVGNWDRPEKHEELRLEPSQAPSPKRGTASELHN